LNKAPQANDRRAYAFGRRLATETGKLWLREVGEIRRSERFEG
jgi:hypothetical protein